VGWTRGSFEKGGRETPKVLKGEKKRGRPRNRPSLFTSRTKKAYLAAPRERKATRDEKLMITERGVDSQKLGGGKNPSKEKVKKTKPELIKILNSDPVEESRY